MVAFPSWYRAVAGQLLGRTRPGTRLRQSFLRHALNSGWAAVPRRDFELSESAEGFAPLLAEPELKAEAVEPIGPEPDFADVRRRARALARPAVPGQRPRFRSPRRRVLVAAVTAAVAITAVATALGYRYLGPSPGLRLRRRGVWPSRVPLRQPR